MAQEKQFQSELPALLQSLFGSKTTTKQNSTSTANTVPLQEAFNQAQSPMTQQLYDNLIASIFQKSAGQVPTLTAALANATGTRSSGNSALALALNEQNNMAAKDSASAILSQQNEQARTAVNAATGIAQATKGGTNTTTAKQGAGVNPLATTALGFILNQADKQGLFKGFGSSTTLAPVLASNFPAAAPSFGTDFVGPATSFQVNTPVLDSAGLGSGMALAPSFGGLDFSQLGAGFSEGIDASPIGDFSGFDFSTLGEGALSDNLSLDFGTGDNFGLGTDFGSDLGNAFTGGLTGGGTDQLPWEDLLGFFADGGSTKPVQRNRNNMGQSPTLFGQSAINSTAGGGSTVGAGNDVLTTMLTRAVQQIQAGTARPASPTVPQPATDGAGVDPSSRETAGGAINARAGNPQGNAVAQALAMAALGMIAPGIMGGMTGSAVAAGLTNPAIKGITGMSTSPLNLAMTLARAVNADSQATSAIQTAEDPLGAMLAAFNAIDGTIGDVSAVGSNNLAAGANAVSSITGQDPLEAMLATTNAFGTGTTGTSGTGDNTAGPGLAGSFGDTGGNTFGGGLSGGFGGGLAADQGFGDPADFADGGLTGSRPTPSKKKPATGLIKGRGTGTSDSIPAKSTVPGGRTMHLSTDEYIVPADVMQVPGVKSMLDSLLQNYHAPVNR